MSHSVELVDVEMIFGSTRAVEKLSLSVRPGEFFSILGPSGCGKTTILRLIAGFLEPTAGRVLIGGEDMAGLSANRRPTAMIFQSLALFPLMPVWENIAFGLEVRGLSKADRRRRADELLELIALPGFADRKIHELSGGQKQRVAIARALAVEPQVLLLDEPLSALDLKLRQHMRGELRELQRRTSVTFVYITHDQSEALAMSDRVAVMSAGVLQQVATPRELYGNPKTPFVAEFVGETNTLAGRVVQMADGNAVIEGPLGRFVGRAGSGAVPGARAQLYVRPEALAFSSGEVVNAIRAIASRLDFEGAFATAHATADDATTLQLAIPSTRLGVAPSIGQRVTLSFDPADAVVLADG